MTWVTNIIHKYYCYKNSSLEKWDVLVEPSCWRYVSFRSIWHSLRHQKNTVNISWYRWDVNWTIEHNSLLQHRYQYVERNIIQFHHLSIKHTKQWLIQDVKDLFEWLDFPHLKYYKQKCFWEIFLLTKPSISQCALSEKVFFLWKILWVFFNPIDESPKFCYDCIFHFSHLSPHRLLKLSTNSSFR